MPQPPIIEPTLSKYGRLEWKIALTSPQFPYSTITVDYSGYLSLTGTPWTLTPEDAEVVSKALNNAARWMATSWTTDFYDRLEAQRAGGTDD